MRLLLGTDDGVRVLSQSDSRWEAGSAALSGHDVHDLARFRGALFAATYGEGVWRSDDGRSWAAASEGLSHPVVRSLLDLDDTLLAGTEPARAFRSTDGSTWTELRLGDLPEAGEWWLPYSPRAGALRHLMRDRHDPERLYGAIEVGGVAVSPDVGRTWSLMNAGIHEDVHALAQSPDGDLYAATGGGFFRLLGDARGSTPRWRGVHSGLEREYVSVVAALGGGVVLIVGAWGPGDDAVLYRSEDRGRSFAPVTRGLPAEFPRGAWALAVHESGTYLGTTAGALFASVDAGRSWTPIADGLGEVQVILPEG